MYLRTVYIAVKNMDRAVDFYTDFLGMPPTMKAARYSLFRLGSSYLGLYAPGADNTTVNYGDNCIPVLESENLQETLKWLKEKQMTFSTDLLQAGPIQMIQFIDTEGNVIQLAQMAR